ncbi:MAG: hypothetical protein H7A25_26115 [Leptospiraceae bacterium]|nr:hypothetical protein [Leptospiraceae bacterium]
MAKDIYHNILINALVKDGWQVTDDPLFIKYFEKHFYIDFGAEKFLVAEKKKKRIAIELKSFLNPSNIYDFHVMIGQYTNYKMILKEKNSERDLFLGIDENTYNRLKESMGLKSLFYLHNVKLIVFNPEIEEIVKWKN